MCSTEESDPLLSSKFFGLGVHWPRFWERHGRHDKLCTVQAVDAVRDRPGAERLWPAVEFRRIEDPNVKAEAATSAKELAQSKASLRDYIDGLHCRSPDAAAELEHVSGAVFGAPCVADVLLSSAGGNLGSKQQQCTI